MSEPAFEPLSNNPFIRHKTDLLLHTARVSQRVSFSTLILHSLPSATADTVSLSNQRDEQISIEYMIAHKNELVAGQSYIVVENGVARHYKNFVVAYPDVVGRHDLYECTYRGWPSMPKKGVG